MKPKSILFDSVFEKRWHKYLMGFTEKQKGAGMQAGMGSGQAKYLKIWNYEGKRAYFRALYRRFLSPKEHY